ncbi:MAG: 50S ribosomal protein L24 [archaeon]
MTTHNPGKQRLKVYEADLVLQHTLMAGHLSKELRTKYARRGLPLRVGDTVKVVRGDYKGKAGSINQVDQARNNVFIQGLMRKKADGKEAFIAFRPSNLLITAVDAKDKKRFKRMKKETKKESPAVGTNEKTAGAGKKE